MLSYLRPIVISLATLLLSVSCGYRTGQSALVSKFQTVTIPYVEGDWDGQLTAALVRQISQSGRLTYRAEGGALLLKVELLDISDENIGFRYDRNKEGKRKNRIVPDETRSTAYVIVTVIETLSGSVLMGPVQLSADVVFDHDYYSSRNGVNIFSLGQLTDVDEAHDAAQRPLNQRLAQKIVDYVIDNW